MLVIRLFRVGKKNQPSFKIVVTDKRRPPRAGRFVEEVGFWNPLTKEKVFKAERIKYWISVGAKPSDTLHNLLVSEKIIEGKKIPVHKTKKAEEKTKEEKPKEETPKEEAPKEAPPTSQDENKDKDKAEPEPKTPTEPQKEEKKEIKEDKKEEKEVK